MEKSDQDSLLFDPLNNDIQVWNRLHGIDIITFTLLWSRSVILVGGAIYELCFAAQSKAV